MRAMLIAILAVVALGLVGCQSGTCAGPSSVPVMDINLPSLEIPPPIWFHGEPVKPEIVPSGYQQIVPAQACAPAAVAKPIPQAPAWVPAPAAAPAAAGYCP